MSTELGALRVVVASPSDVEVERALVPSVLDEINRTVAADRGLHLEDVRWETDTYPGFHVDGPQGLIDPILRVEDCDLLIGIFWRRFGTLTEERTTGTEHEFQTAYQAWQKRGSPQVMVYFNQKAYAPQSKEEADQWGRVLQFRESFPKEGLWWPYRGATQFERLLRTHIANFLRQKFPVANGEAETAAKSISLRTQPVKRSDYFSVQTRTIEEHASLFVGRLSVLRELDQFMKTRDRGFFVVVGAPGQGKTAVACQLIARNRYVHHLVSRTGGRTDSRLILRSLISQLLSVAGETAPIPESLAELPKLYEELLLQLSSKGKPIVIVIDALDELPPEADEEPPYLGMEGLPTGVFFVVTSRPGLWVDRLRALQVRTPCQIHELGPLSLEDMTAILLARRSEITGPEVERIAEASQGNPLYLRAVVDQLEIDPDYDLRNLPASIEGFFLNAVRTLGEDDSSLHEALGLLSVARTPLSLAELAGITEKSQREISEHGVMPVVQFLIKLDGRFTFYHARFHEFVTNKLLYEDEIRRAHSQIARWLQRPENRNSRYRRSSLAYHLFEAGDCEALLSTIDEAFLLEKVADLGYAVLEDVELYTRCLLIKGDPSLIERCVAMVERLREKLGGDLVTEVSSAVRPYRSGPPSFRSRILEPAVPTVEGLDVYVAVLPKGEISADFFEIVPLNDHLVVAIGDAPAIGLKSAFVARFIASLFRDLLLKSLPLPEVLAQINSRVTSYDYFRRVTMQCLDLDPKRGVVHMVNAGHPYPVHYSAKTRTCDVLPLLGEILASSPDASSDASAYRSYGLSVAPGDVLVMISDGLTEAQLLRGDPYGYSFKQVVVRHAKEGARAIGEAIVDDWRAHPREEDWADDVSVIVIAVR